MRYHYLMFATLLCCPSAYGIGITVIPSPLAGNSGLAGWGFNLTNDTGSYLSVDSVQLAGSPDHPLERFGPSSNFVDLFSTYQFNSPAILIGPNSIFSQAYDSAGQGLAAWDFPDGYATYGSLTSDVFQIQVGYSLYDDNAYGTPSLDGGGSPIFGTLTVDAQLQYAAATLSLTPALLSGDNGTQGWGFTLNNFTSSYLSVDSVQLAGLVDDPLNRFGPSTNFSDLFATYQFSAPTILIGPNSTFSQDYNGAGQGLAAWEFPSGYATYGSLTSNVFQVQLGYSLYDDNAYNTPSLDGSGGPATGSLAASAQLQYGASASAVPEPAPWLLVALGLGLSVLGKYRRDGRRQL